MSYRRFGVALAAFATTAAGLVAGTGTAAAATCPSNSVCLFSDPGFGGQVDVVTAAELAAVDDTTVPCVSTDLSRSAINNTARDVVVYNLPCGDFVGNDPVGAVPAGGSESDFGLGVSFVGH